MYKTVLLETKDNIATISLNRPEMFNSFDEMLFDDVTAAFEACNKDEDVKVVIVTGSGKNFSGGGDIKEMATFKFLTPELAAKTGKMIMAVKKCSKPVIAMVNGSAAGAGCGLALAADFRIMTEKSSLVTAFINMALSGDTSCMYNLYHMVGLAKATEMMMLSAPVRGKEAFELGLATKLVELDELERATMELAEVLKKKPAVAIAGQKKVFYDTFFHDFEKYCEVEVEEFVKCANTQDHVEAVNAFFEKRKPDFIGK